MAEVGGRGGRRDGTLRASLFVVVATASGSVANFLYQWLAARLLDPETFSLLIALLAVVTLAVLPGPPLAIAIVRRRTDGLAGARSAGLLIGLAIFLGVLAGSLLIGGAGAVGEDRFHFGDRSPLLLWSMAALAAAAWLFLYPDLARAQSAGAFRRYGGAHAALSVTRLVIGGGAILAGWPLWGMLLALVPGPVLVRALLLRPASLPGAGNPIAATSTRGWIRETLPLLAATGGLHALVLIDVVFARIHFGDLDSHSAGAYAACATLARALFHLPFAATAVTVQRTVAARESHDGSRGSPRSILLANLGLVAVLLAAGGGILAAVPEFALEVFAGEGRYTGESAWLVRLLVPMALASVAAVPAHSLLALRSRVPVVVLGIAPFVLAALLATRPADPGGLIPPMTTVLTVVTGILLVAAWVRTSEGSAEGDEGG